MVTTADWSWGAPQISPVLTNQVSQGRVNLPPGLGGGMGMAANSPRLPGGNPLHMRDPLNEPQASRNLLDMLGKSQAERNRPFPLLGQQGGQRWPCSCWCFWVQGTGALGQSASMGASCAPYCPLAESTLGAGCVIAILPSGAALE